MTRMIAILIAVIGVPPVTAAQPVTGAEGEPKDVIVVALGDEHDSPAAVSNRLSRSIFGEDKGSRTVRDVQMAIVAATARFGPVLILAPDPEARAWVWADCEAYAVCSELMSGQVRVAVVPHDTPWIRDYGPIVSVWEDPNGDAGGVTVVDAKYFDVRADDRRRERVSHLSIIRSLMLAHLASAAFNEDKLLPAVEELLNFGGIGPMPPPPNRTCSD